MARVNKPQILENLFWRCNSKVDVDIYAEMGKLATINKESNEVQDAIYNYLSNRLGFGKYEENMDLLVFAGYIEADGNEDEDQQSNQVETTNAKTNKNEKDIKPLKELAAELIAQGKHNYFYYQRGLGVNDMKHCLQNEEPAYLTPKGYIMVKWSHMDKFKCLGYV